MSTTKYLHLADADLDLIIEALRTSGQSRIAQNLAVRIENSRKPGPNDLAYRETAQRIHSKEGELEIDDNALVSDGDDSGAYVMAWIWVRDLDVPDDIREATGFCPFDITVDEVRGWAKDLGRNLTDEAARDIMAHAEECVSGASDYTSYIKECLQNLEGLADAA